MTFPLSTKPNSIKERVVALIQALMLDNDRLGKMVSSSNFKSAYKPVILTVVRQLPNLIGPMLAQVSDEDLAAGLREVRDQYIPFLLDELPVKPEPDNSIDKPPFLQMANVNEDPSTD